MTSPVAYLAQRIVPSYSDILLLAHEAGVAAAVRAYVGGSHCCGGAGDPKNGAPIHWRLEGQRISFWAAAVDAEPTVVPLREVFAWALARVGPEVWAELKRLRAARSAVLHEEYGDADLSHRAMYRPEEVTAAERARLSACRVRREELEVAARNLVAGGLTDEAPVVGQLGLFDLGVAS